ncbi:protein odr-4 homolog [Leptopilina heterotoma]|uniref:protein odr-4 homolog n=1 Tax=Leptopilina heterotoma TaxID=63436 RepID=UPI001CA9B6D0|nr:protein odr-4 homolog [Leptopilina heterotoma]
MPRTIFANDDLLDYLTSLANPTGYTIGLILGQSCEQKDFVIHLARTSQPSKKDVIEESVLGSSLNVSQESFTSIKSIKDIPGSWVADHAKHVTRMLPGGMWVLGIFTVGPEDVFTTNASVEKLKAILSSVEKNLIANPHLYGNHEEESLLLHFNSLTKKYICKSMDAKNFLKPVDWKFQSNSTFTKWHHLETLVDFDRVFPISRLKTPNPLKKQLQDILSETTNMINSSLVVIEGELRSDDAAVETIGKQLSKEKKTEKESSGDNESEKKILQVGIYIPCQKNFDMQTIECTGSMRLVGQLVSRTFVHQKATIEEAVNAVKQDILRSLASRLEMHWDSLIEEEDGSPEETITLHEPPRRVLIQLPRNKVSLSDYLFPGEGTQESLLSLRELLDIKVQECNINKDLELQVDPSEFYCQSADTRTSDTASIQKNIIGKKNIFLFITGFSFALLILIVAIIFNRA